MKRCPVLFFFVYFCHVTVRYIQKQRKVYFPSAVPVPILFHYFLIEIPALGINDYDHREILHFQSADSLSA